MANKKRVLIFGLGDMAEVANYYFENDTDYDVAGFTVDKAFCDSETFEGRPIVPFEEICVRFPPESFELFVAVGYSQLNGLRRRKIHEAKEMGYQLASYISSRATILNGHRFGENCFILEDNTIQPFAEIGDGVVMWSGNHIGHHSRIGGFSFLASHIVVSGRVTIGECCFIGVNVTIRDGVSVGSNCILGAGTILLADADANGVYSPEATPRSRVPSSRLRKI